MCKKLNAIIIQSITEYYTEYNIVKLRAIFNHIVFTRIV